MEVKLGAKPTPRHILAKVPFIHEFLDPLRPPLSPDQCRYSKGMHGPWGDLGNIDYGCCIFSGYGHYKQCATSNVAGKPASVTTDQVLDWYSGATGFRKDDPSTDQGSDPITALNYFRRIGEIEFYGRVDLAEPSHVALACYLWGGLYTVLGLPIAWQRKSVWRKGPNTLGDWEPWSWGGHCVFQSDFTPAMDLGGVTWGDSVVTEYAAVPIYMPEAYVIGSKHWEANDGKTIQGFDLQGLKDRLALVA